MKSVAARLLRLFKKNRKVLLASIFSLLILWASFSSVFPTFIHAQAGVPTSGWVQDPEVTLVGKAAERARQLLWWTIRNPGVYSAPVIAEYWSISRNIVYVFTLLVIIMFGFSYILLRRRASVSTIMPIIFKIAFVLLFATLSYIILLALIQFSEISMRFFIEQVGGRDLFNVIFSGGPNAGRDPFESNYYNFVGYREISASNQEMVQTSLFLIRFTTFTYYIMSIMLILRTIILWFLLVLSPFLVILLPFVFIRNTGLIWIGVFFQWLFYGPLVAVFLGAITKIWVRGIPFPFDFARAGKVDGQIYKTSINILYGGPAQQLGPANSANYVDTFAEYVIALVMLWTAIVLPWLLLRIFRDYCCIAIAAGNATLTAIYDRLRQYPPATPPPAPSGSSTGTAVDLPFRQNINQNVNVTTPARVEMIKEIEKTNTEELTKTLNLSVSRLSDVSRIETNQYAQSQIRQQLATLAAPESAASSSEKERFTILRQELQSRAASGDRQARILLNASGHRNENLSATVNVVIENRNIKGQNRELIREREIEREKEVLRERSEKSTANTVSDMVRMNPNIAKEIAQSTQVSESTVNKVLQSVTAGSNSSTVSNEKIASLSREQSMSESKIREIVNTAQSKTEIMTAIPAVSEIAQKVNLPETTINNVLSNLATNQIVDQGAVSQAALKAGISSEKVEEIYQNAQVPEPIGVSVSAATLTHQNDVATITQKVNIEENTVQNILQKLPVANKVSNEVIQSISSTTGVSNEMVEQIYKNTVGVASIPAPSVIAQKVGTNESAVVSVLSAMPKQETVGQSVFERIAKETNTSKENVSSVYEQTQVSVPALTHQNDVATITQKVNIEENTVQNILQKLPVANKVSNEVIQSISSTTGVSNEMVEQIYKNTVGVASIPAPSVIAQKVGTNESAVVSVLSAMPKQETVGQSVFERIAKETNTSKENVSSVYEQTQVSVPALTHQNDVATITQKLSIEQKTVQNILEKIPVTEVISNEIVQNISESTGVASNVVEQIYQNAVGTQTVPSRSVIAEKVKTTESVVAAVLPLIPKQQDIKESVIEKIASETNTSKKNVSSVYEKTQTSIQTAIPQMAPAIADRLHLEKDKVQKVLSVLPAWGTPSYNTIMKAAHVSDLPVEKVKNIAKIASVSMMGTSKQSIDEIVKASGESETIVKEVLEALPKSGYPTPSKMADAAQKAGISEARVKAIVTASHTASTKTTTSGIASTISLEDYEEVKRMWLNHYRSAPVPVNETIKNRSGWLTHEEKKLQDVSELISSQDPKVKEKGLEKVSEILPFLLLGGFSDAEILTYLKAKEEAAKQVTDELVVATTTREETAKTIASQDESTMVAASGKEETKAAVSDTLSATFGDEEESELPQVSSSQNWVQKINILPTGDIASNLNLVVNRIIDIARPEIEKDKHADAVKNLSNISSPDKIFDTHARADFEGIRHELESRATAGDKVAQRILTASNNPASDVTPAASFILVSNRKSLGVTPPKKSVSYSIYERSLKDPSISPYLATKYSVPVTVVHQVIEEIAGDREVTDQKLNEISTKVHLPLQTIKGIVTGAKELLQINALTPSDIAQKVSLPIKDVKAVLEKIPTDHAMTVSEREEISKSTKTSLLQIQSIEEFTKLPIEHFAASLVPFLAEKYSLPDATIHTIFHTVTSYTVLTPEKIEALSGQLGVKQDTLRQILAAVDENFILKSDPYILEISKTIGEPLKTVQSIVESLPSAGMPNSLQIQNIAKDTGLSLDKIKKIAELLHAQRKDSELLPASVSIDDYEEVKNMWINYYKNSPVPLSDEIKDRYSWTLSEEKNIQSVSDLVSSPDPKEKQKGLEGISEILPFVLLGGFSDVEILTYLKAKYQAARTVRIFLESNSIESENKPDSTTDSSEIIDRKNVSSPLTDMSKDQNKEIPVPEEKKEKSDPQDKVLSDRESTSIIDKGPVKKEKDGGNKI